MIVSILSVEILRFCKKNNVTIKMPEQVPPSVSRSFEALIPRIRYYYDESYYSRFKVDLHYVVDKLAAPLVKAGDSYFGVIIPVFLITFFWSFGIHGVSVVGTVARPLWDVYLGKNGEAVASGASHFPFIAPEPFYQWFIWIGGSGATLACVSYDYIWSIENIQKHYREHVLSLGFLI